MSTFGDNFLSFVERCLLVCSGDVEFLDDTQVASARLHRVGPGLLQQFERNFWVLTVVLHSPVVGAEGCLLGTVSIHQ